MPPVEEIDFSVLREEVGKGTLILILNAASIQASLLWSHSNVKVYHVGTCHLSHKVDDSSWSSYSCCGQFGPSGQQQHIQYMEGLELAFWDHMELCGIILVWIT